MSFNENPVWDGLARKLLSLRAARRPVDGHSRRFDGSWTRTVRHATAVIVVGNYDEACLPKAITSYLTVYGVFLGPVYPSTAVLDALDGNGRQKYPPNWGLEIPKISETLCAQMKNVLAALLVSIFDSKSAEDIVLKLDGDSAQSFLDVVQEALDRGFLMAQEHSRKARRIIRKLSESCDKLPSALFITGANILINQDWSACLADFGLSDFSNATSSGTSNRAGSLYWMAPELIDPNRFRLKFARTPASDVYAFGCVCLELYTGRHPFSELSEATALLRIVNNERPGRPDVTPAMSDALWQNVMAYWSENPATRPLTEVVVEGMAWAVLPRKLNLLRPLPPLSEVLPSSTPTSFEQEPILWLHAIEEERPSQGRQLITYGLQNRKARTCDSMVYPSSATSMILLRRMIRLMQDVKRLDEDVLDGLVRGLKIPAPSLTNPSALKEILFPANLINLVTSDMWKYGLIPESERFLANVMQTIQAHVMSFTGEEAIVPGIFWLSNVHEMLDMLQGIGPGEETAVRSFDWNDYERLVSVVKHNLDSLEYNIYRTWMLETKRKLSKMVIPALIESQSLPGFKTSDSGGRLFNRLLNANRAPAYSMVDILNMLNKQASTELLKLIGVTAFNDLLMRRHFSSWNRARQIQYNITRIEEWCKSHDMPEGTLQLEHLMQATKVLELKKATAADIDIIGSVCWMLSPMQIQRMCMNYYVADYENPISPEILKVVASRVQANDRNSDLLLSPETEDVRPYELPLPRHVSGPETYVPAYLNVSHLRRLAALVSYN
ncbi:DIL domain-containing protein [Mycena vulgaris]|nr:DIL domain-containing protein [Mycena vulgaris]